MHVPGSLLTLSGLTGDVRDWTRQAQDDLSLEHRDALLAVRDQRIFG